MYYEELRFEKLIAHIAPNYRKRKQENQLNYLGPEGFFGKKFELFFPSSEYTNYNCSVHDYKIKKISQKRNKQINILYRISENKTIPQATVYSQVLICRAISGDEKFFQTQKLPV